MLPLNLASQVWATCMLVSVLLYFLPQTIMHPKLPQNKASSIIYHEWIVKILNMSIYRHIYKVGLITLYLISLILFLSSTRTIFMGAQLLKVVSLVFLLEDTVIPVFIYSVILANSLSRQWLLLYLYITVPFLLPAMALSVHCELTLYSMHVGVSIYLSPTTIKILYLLQTVFLSIECIMLYTLHKRLFSVGYDALQPDLCLLSSSRSNSNTPCKRISLIFALSNNVFGLFVYRIGNLILMTIFLIISNKSVVQSDTNQYLLTIILTTIKLIVFLQKNSSSIHFSDTSSSHSIHSLVFIMMNPALLTLFIKYCSHFSQATDCLLFLYDASLYGLEVLTAQSTRSVKECIVTFNMRWFQDSQYFPPNIAQKVSEKVLTLLLRSNNSNTLPELQAEALDLFSLPEKYACAFLHEVTMPLFYQSSMGISVLTTSIFLGKVSPYNSAYFENVFPRLLKDCGQEKKISTLYNMMHSNPLMIFAIIDIVSHTIPAHQLQQLQRQFPTVSIQRHTSQFRSISYQIKRFGRKSYFFNKCLFRQLSSIAEYVLHTNDLDSTTKKCFISAVQELQDINVQNRIHSMNTSYSLDYIQHILNPIVGQRKQSSHERILSKGDVQSQSTHTMHLRSSKKSSNNYKSIFNEPEDITKSVDEFLSTTFCPRQSFDSTIKKIENKPFDNRLNSEIKNFAGKYLIERIVQLEQPVHALFKDLDEREKRNFRELCIPKHVLFNTELFIVSINSHMDCSFWPQLMTTTVDNTKSICFQFAHSRDGTERSPRMMIRSPTGFKKSKTLIILNHIKLFRLVYSSLHHLNLITEFSLPLAALSTLCLWLTSNETNNYYNSSMLIYIIRSTFLFIYSIDHDSPGFLPKHIALAMLLTALCCMYKHPCLSNYDTIASAHWIADLYADNAPATNFCTAMGWIAILQSGLLVHCELMVRRMIKSFYLTFSKSFSEDSITTNYHNVLQSVINKTIVSELDTSRISICKLFISFLMFSTRSYNKATSLFLSINRSLDLQRKNQFLSHILLNQEMYLNQDAYSLDQMALRESIELATMSIPILMLLKESLTLISVSYNIKFEYTFQQIRFFIKHTNASIDMWRSILK